MEAAIKLFNRLTEVEKIGLRRATPGAIEYLADTAYRVDLTHIAPAERPAVLTEAQALCNLASAAKEAETGFDGVTWKY